MLRRKFLKGAASFGAISALGGNLSHGAEDSTVPTRSIPEIAGPDKNTKTPVFKMPAGAIDTHCHIFGPAAEYPFSPTRPYTPPEACQMTATWSI
jgi:2-pyrone-4,6-dicarboxylate lactonase